MSRGGQPQPGGWRKTRMGGIELPWDYDPDLKIESKPSEMFPPLPRPAVAKPSRAFERKQVAKYRILRDRIHEGPLYTVLGNNVRVSKSTKPATTSEGFDDMPSYTQKYHRKARRIPRLDTRPYVIRFFPTELLSTLDPSHAKAPNGAAVTKPKKKSLQLAKANQRTRLEMFEEDADRRIAGEDAEDEDGENRLNDDEEEPEEERDDEFEEDDEEDDSNDYNAEKYFDDGEADDYGGDDDLGGGGDEYY